LPLLQREVARVELEGGVSSVDVDMLPTIKAGRKRISQ